jgi:3-methyl-2-oxobutanoate hydroxymethyltransferase
MKPDKITLPKLQQKKRRGEKITMLTCYDYTFARLLEKTNIDSVLVGDSLGMVVQGKENTLPVTVDEMIYHSQMVHRGAPRPFLISDMPFLSYQSSIETALHNAGRLLKEGCAEAVKLEGGEEICETVARIVSVGIPVIGHIGLMPQSVHAMGGYKIQGAVEEDATRLIKEAQVLEEAGAGMIVLEGISSQVAQNISSSIQIPAIGIGSGPHCDGQVLVIYDLLGMDKSFKPKFIRHYENFEDKICQAVGNYVKDVTKNAFPSLDESFSKKTTNH